MKIRRGNKIVEKNRSKRRVKKNRKCWSVEYSVFGSEVATMFTIIFKVQRR
jgi:hypothetical protein